MQPENDIDITYFESNKSGNKILRHGYIYTRNIIRGQSSYWICEEIYKLNYNKRNPHGIMQWRIQDFP